MKRVTTLLLLALFALAAGGCDSSNATEDTISSRQQTAPLAVTPAPGKGNSYINGDTTLPTPAKSDDKGPGSGSANTKNSNTPKSDERSETSNTSYSNSSSTATTAPVKSDEGPKVY